MKYYHSILLLHEDGRWGHIFLGSGGPSSGISLGVKVEWGEWIFHGQMEGKWGVYANV